MLLRDFHIILKKEFFSSLFNLKFYSGSFMKRLFRQWCKMIVAVKHFIGALKYWVRVVHTRLLETWPLTEDMAPNSKGNFTGQKSFYFAGVAHVFSNELY